MPQDRAYAARTEADGNPRTKLIRVEINTSVITYNFMEKRRPLSVAVLELISNILGDTNNGLTGTEIHRFLLQAKIEDILEKGQFVSKRVRLFKAFVNFQDRYQCCNNILKCIQLILTPSRYVGRLEEFEELRTKINQQLAFEGYEINENGKFSNKKKANVISDVELKVENIKQELTERKAHAQIFKYCTPELLTNNYFHAVFEAQKGLFQRIRDLSGLTSDGTSLIEQAFSRNPILIINKFQTNQEMDEHTGFCNILKGLCGMFRNSGAHQPKIYWNIDEQDALEILGLISYCHRRLDNVQRIR